MLQKEQYLLGRFAVSQLFKTPAVPVIGQFGVIRDGQRPQTNKIRIDLV